MRWHCFGLLLVLLLAPVAARAQRLTLLGEPLAAPFRGAERLRLPNRPVSLARGPARPMLAARGFGGGGAGGLETAPADEPSLAPISAPRFIGTFLLADVAGLSAMVLGGAGGFIGGLYLGMSPLDSGLLVATYGAGILAATATMAGVATGLFSPGNSRASFWASWLGALVATGVTIGLGYAAGSGEFDVALAVLLPALGALIGAGMSREPVGDDYRPQPAPGPEPEEVGPDDDDEDEDEYEYEEARGVPRVPAQRALGASSPRAAVVPILAIRF